jgi:DNA-binding transcriptional MerR regulator
MLYANNINYTLRRESMLMEQKYFTIGKIAKMMNVTVKALRFYEKIGLLKPEYIDPETKYRYYCASQLIYIDLIKAARNLDISPYALVPHFAGKNTNELVGLMHGHKDMLAERLRSLQKTIDQIETIEKTLKSAECIDKSGAVYLRDIPDRYAVTWPLDTNRSEEDISMDFYLLNASLSQAGLTYAYEGGVIYSPDKDTLRPECIYASVLEDKGPNGYRLLPGGRYICTVFQKQNAQEQYTKLMEYVTGHNLKPQLIVQTELLTDFFADMPEYFEVQVRTKPQEAEEITETVKTTGTAKTE